MTMLAHAGKTQLPNHELRQMLWRSEVVPAETKELMRVRAARNVDCFICQNTRVGVADEQLVEEDVVKQIAGDFETAALPEQDKVLLRFLDSFYNNPAGLTDEVRQGMLDHFTEEQIVECAIFLAAGFARMLIVFGLEPQEMSTTVSPITTMRGEPARMTELVQTAP